MIQILPLEDREREKKILNGLGLSGEELRVLAMSGGGEEMGTVALQVKEGALIIHAMTAAGYESGARPDMEQTFILDSLMRSAASYGENRGADRIETTFPDPHGFFKARGFETDETHAFTPMSTIVHYDFQ